MYLKTPKLQAEWSILLQNYDFTVKYKKGKLNTNADAISRLENLPPPENDNPNDINPRHVDLFAINPDPQDVIDRENSFQEYMLYDPMEPVIFPVMPVNDIDIVNAQKECPDIGPIYEFIHTGNLPENSEIKPSIIADEPQYLIKNNVLLHLYQPRVRNLEKHK